MCCGQKRSQLKSNYTTTTAQKTPQSVSGTQSIGGSRLPQPVGARPSAEQRRQIVSTYQTARRQRQISTTTPPSSINVRYLETSPIRVRGSVSGMIYEFSGPRAVQQVDARDASSLLKTRFFRPA